MSQSRNEIRRQGVILHVFDDAYQKVVILDEHKGKIICFVPDKKLCIGAIIEYNLLKKRKYCTAHMINIVKMPFTIAKIDILFLHHVLELCYYFLQEGLPAADVFELILYLYVRSDRFVDSLCKNIYLAKLFVLFGIYPEKPYIELVYWEQIVQHPIQSVLETCTDMQNESELIIWIRSCVYMHPRHHMFKTLACIEQNR